VRIHSRRTPAACSPLGGSVARRTSNGHPEHRPPAGQLILRRARSRHSRLLEVFSCHRPCPIA
jgi:hypothetical protein